MAMIGMLLTEGPWQSENYKVFAKIAEAALDKGHEVKAFWYLDGVYNAIKHQKFPGTTEENLPVSGMKRVVEKGAKITACGICVNGRGLEGGKEFIEGVKVGGLPDFADIMGECDTLVTL
ncbi:MAG: DsrE family protein [Candidatus Desantisbacteria bacterium]